MIKSLIADNNLNSVYYTVSSIFIAVAMAGQPRFNGLIFRFYSRTAPLETQRDAGTSRAHKPLSMVSKKNKSVSHSFNST